MKSVSYVLQFTLQNYNKKIKIAYRILEFETHAYNVKWIVYDYHTKAVTFPVLDVTYYM